MAKDINTLIRKHLSGSISAEELNILRAFLEAHPDEAEKYEAIANAENLAERYREYASVDTKAALQRFLHGHAELSTEEKFPGRKLVRMLRYAAAILVLIVAGAGIWYSQYTKVTPPEISETVQLAMQQSIQSGKADAVIENESNRICSDEEPARNGAKGYLQTEQDESISSPSDTQTPAFSTQTSTLTKEQLLAARRITTRHDKEFWLTLDDGTLIHLNYNTRLIYPEKFGRGNRNVILDGEAYFMVAKDKSRPFIVHTPDGDVKVYGTEFNVNTRNEVLNEQSSTANSTSVVLVKGSVSVTPAGGDEVMMKPGEQSIIAGPRSMADGKGSISVSTIDVEPYVAWNEGSFVFENTTLEQLMRVMAQWYSVRNVVFKDNRLRQIHFTGSLQRYGDINRVVQAITTVCDVEVAKQGDVLIISNK